MRYLILHNIRSHYNVGAIFRTAEAAGVKRIYLTGYTPTPRDRFGREVPEIKKTSLGASAMVPWEYHADVFAVIEHLREDGTEIVSVEIAPGSVSLYEHIPKANVAYIFGNEITGVSEDVLKISDTILEIPMAGMKESLNVSVTAGIVLFRYKHDT